MTSVCHPFILIGTVLLPDDCSDVYHQLEYVSTRHEFLFYFRILAIGTRCRFSMTKRETYIRHERGGGVSLISRLDEVNWKDTGNL